MIIKALIIFHESLVTYSESLLASESDLKEKLQKRSDEELLKYKELSLSLSWEVDASPEEIIISVEQDEKHFQFNNNDFKGPVNLPLTMGSGQTSQPAWLEQDGYFQEVILVEDEPCLVKIKCESKDVEGSLDVEVESPQEIQLKVIQNEIKDIFGLNDDLNRLYEFLKEDPKLSPTVEFCRGLRIFKAHNPLNV